MLYISVCSSVSEKREGVITFDVLFAKDYGTPSCSICLYTTRCNRGVDFYYGPEFSFF